MEMQKVVSTQNMASIRSAVAVSPIEVKPQGDKKDAIAIVFINLLILSRRKDPEVLKQMIKDKIAKRANEWEKAAEVGSQPFQFEMLYRKRGIPMGYDSLSDEAHPILQLPNNQTLRESVAQGAIYVRLRIGYISPVDVNRAKAALEEAASYVSSLFKPGLPTKLAKEAWSLIRDRSPAFLKLRRS